MKNRIWLNDERTVFVEVWLDEEGREKEVVVATRVHAGDTWGPPITVKEQPKSRVHEMSVVVDVESEPPKLLGVLMPPREPEEAGVLVRYYDTGADEEEHTAPADCVVVQTIVVELPEVNRVFPVGDTE